jgi:hypothetical protein
MADVNISKYRAQVVREGSTPASPGFVVSEGQNPVDPSGSGQNHLPVTIAAASTGLSITESQVLGGSGTTSQYLRGDGSLATFPSLTGFVPYTGATADVDLGTFDLLAERGTFENNGSSNTLTVNHTSGSGYGIIVTKGGNNEALYVNKTSGSGNAMTVVGGRTSLVDLALSSVTNTAGDFLTLSGGVVHKRTAAQVLTDIGGQAALTNPVTGTIATGQVAFGTAANTIGGNSGFLFDSSLRQLRIFSSIQQLLYNATSGILQLNGSALDTAPTIKINQLTGNDTSYGNLEFLGTRSSLTIVAKIRSNRRGVLDFCTQDAPNAGDPPVRWSITNTGILQSNGAQTIQTSSGALTLQSGNRNVLINTTTDAGFRLDVNGTARVTGVATFSSTLSALKGDFGSAFTSTNVLQAIAPSATNSDMFQVGMLGVSNGFTIKRVSSVFNYAFNDGNVGIGTDAPSVKLNVSNPANGNIALFTNTADADLFVNLTSGVTLLTPSTGTLAFGTLNTERVRLNLNGNLLVGTTLDNGSKLQVNGSFSAPHVTKSANYTLDSTDYTVGFDCASNRTATLPDATTCQGRIYVIYQFNTGSGARSVTLDGNGSQTINGVTTYSLSPFCEYTSVMIQSNGANWIIISSNFTTDCL